MAIGDFIPTPMQNLENAGKGAAAGSPFGPKGALIGAAGGLVFGGIQQALEGIGKWSSNRAQQQQILNQMVAAGYPITGQVPSYLSVPKGAQRQSGTNPQNAAIFFDPATGNPIISNEHPGQPYTGPENSLAIKPEQLQKINQDFYTGQGAQHRADYDQANLGPTGITKEAWQQGAAVPGLEKQPIVPMLPTQASGGPGGNTGGGNPTDGGYNWWHGRKAQNEQVPVFTPKQSAYQESVIDQLMKNKADFGPIRDEEIRRFKEETAPYLAERYFGRNPQSFGSAYPEALGRGGASLGSKLAAMQAQYEAAREGRQQQVALQPSFTTLRTPREPGFKDVVYENAPALMDYASKWWGSRGGSEEGGGGGSTSSGFKRVQPQEEAQVIPQPEFKQPFQQLTPQNAASYQDKSELADLSKSLSNVNTPRSPWEALLQKQSLTGKKVLGGGY